MENKIKKYKVNAKTNKVVEQHENDTNSKEDDSSVFELEASIAEQIYEQTIIRAFEHKKRPLEQLLDDFIDIVLWLDLCMEVSPINKRLAYIKYVETQLKKIEE